VTIVEFADFRCPFCEQFFTNTESQLIKDYVDTGKVQFYLDNMHSSFASTVAADAAECANDQGKFWDFHDYLYKNQPGKPIPACITPHAYSAAISLAWMDPP